MLLVNGRSLVPSPAARIIAFMTANLTECGYLRQIMGWIIRIIAKDVELYCYQWVVLFPSASRAPMARRAMREGSMTLATAGDWGDENDAIFR